MSFPDKLPSREELAARTASRIKKAHEKENINPEVVDATVADEFAKARIPDFVGIFAFRTLRENGHIQSSNAKISQPVTATETTAPPTPPTQPRRRSTAVLGFLRRR